MTGERGRLPKGWRVVLFASLALNLFLVAFTTGRLLHSGIHGHRTGGSLARALTNSGASLSGTDATTFNAIVQRDAARYTEAAQNLTKSRKELRHQIAADPFDPVATKQAYTRWQKDLNVYIDDVGDTFIEALTQISPQGRRKVLEQRERNSDPFEEEDERNTR